MILKHHQKSLPVLMHHLISNDTSFLSVTPEVFEQQCRTLAENGWFGIGLEEAENFFIHGAPLPKKSFLLTFDDGFLDNYVHAWPIMRKYGHKGVIFVVTDRITKSQQDCAAAATGQSCIRPTMADVDNGTCGKEALPMVDTLLHPGDFGFTTRRDLFINWDEARLMEKSGVMAIAGHSTRHESVYAGPAFSSCVQPGDMLSTFSRSAPAAFWGMPDFARVPELANRAFIPSPALVEAIQNLVPQDDADALRFFANDGNTAKLAKLIASFDGKLGDYESPQETTLRMRAIMTETQAVLRRELGHPVKSFCWPWGNYCDEARQEGLAAGFEVFYTTKLGINVAGKPLAVHRFKVKNRTDNGAWLLGRVRLYSRPWLGGLYLALRV